jgi:transcriptional antiterminator
MLTERGLKILQILIESDTPVYISHLADTFKLTERSIRYDIKHINEVLLSNHLPKIRKTNKGTFELISTSEIKKYVESLDSVLYSNEARRNFMLHFIALNCKINLSSMSKMLEISRSTIKNDLEIIKELLNDFNLILTHNDRSGLTLEGEEKDIRHFQFSILLAHFTSDDSENLLTTPVIESYLNSINITLVENYISLVEQQTKTILSEESYLHFKTYLVISIKRIMQGLTLNDEEISESLSSMPEYKSIQGSLHIIEIGYDIHYNKAEVVELMNLFNSSSPYSFPNKPYLNWFEVETFITEFIQRFSQLYDVDLTHDRELKKDLIILIKPIWFNKMQAFSRHELELTHLNIDQQKMYNYIEKVLAQLPQSQFIQLDNQSKLDITLTFITAIERNKYKSHHVKNVIVICAHGYGSSKLLTLQLKQKFNVNIVKILPLHQLKRFKAYSTIDTVITTTPIDQLAKEMRVILVNPILNEQDLLTLKKNGFTEINQTVLLSEILTVLNPDMDHDTKENISDLLKKRLGNLLIDDLAEKKHNLSSLLPLVNIQTNVHVESWEDAIALAGSILVDTHCTKSTYIKELIEAFRLYGSYMIIKENIAIPHAKNENNIFKTGMSLIILDKSVITPFNKTIQVILAFSSFDETEHLDALYEFSNLIQNEEFINLLLTAKESSEVYALIHTHF